MPDPHVLPVEAGLARAGRFAGGGARLDDPELRGLLGGGRPDLDRVLGRGGPRDHDGQQPESDGFPGARALHASIISERPCGRKRIAGIRHTVLSRRERRTKFRDWVLLFI